MFSNRNIVPAALLWSSGCALRENICHAPDAKPPGLHSLCILVSLLLGRCGHQKHSLGHSTAEELQPRNFPQGWELTYLQAKLPTWGFSTASLRTEALNYPALNKWLPCSPKAANPNWIVFFHWCIQWVCSRANTNLPQAR